MKSRLTLDVTDALNTRPGVAYSHRFDGILALLRHLAHAEPMDCLRAPSSWGPLIEHFGHTVLSTVRRYDVDSVAWLRFYRRAKDRRHALEIACSSRPELATALYMADVHWNIPTAYETPEEIPVTCNGSFFRPEVLGWQRTLAQWTPTPGSRGVVLVPCAADKPYPAPLHQAVFERLEARSAVTGKRWSQMIVTGVLGLIPEELWGQEPRYDSGIPNEPRVISSTAWFFSKFRGAFERIVVYSDFYAAAIKHGLTEAGVLDKTTFVFEPRFRDEYANLLTEENLRLLDVALAMDRTE